ncbi:MAG: hypothetical protein WD847_16545, partial [Pirellulales bacterium]
MAERRWYRLHWVTWGALSSCAETSLWRQTSEMPWGCDYVSGWPVKMLSNWSIGGPHLKVHTPGLILNFVVAAALLASTALTRIVTVHGLAHDSTAATGVAGAGRMGED